MSIDVVVTAIFVAAGFGAGWIIGGFFAFREGYWAEHPDDDGKGRKT